MSNIVNNFVNYLYLKERSKEESYVIEINFEKYPHKLPTKNLEKESQLKINYH